MREIERRVTNMKNIKILSTDIVCIMIVIGIVVFGIY